MPSATFFKHLGFFVWEDFLDAELCNRLIAEMSVAPSEQGRMVKDGIDCVLDENSRKVSSSRVHKSTRTLVKQRFLEVLPRLERHFEITLVDCEIPGFLIYHEGCFFEPHTDVGPHAPIEIRKRKISVVVFLNRQSSEPSQNSYGGGALRFYGVLAGPEWDKCGFSLDPEPGMLVAFRSDISHEVQAVTFGQRFTIVTWFLME